MLIICKKSVFLFFCFLISLPSFFAQEQKKISKLTKEIDETSALIAIDHNHFLTINDSGGEAIIYNFNRQGEVFHRCTIQNAKNIDWEALTIDDSGNLYIGDIGNNSNKRKRLTIYKVDLKSVTEQDKVKAEMTNFYYPEQKSFPPIDSEKYYDAEAMFFQNDSLFIVTKNRTVPFDGLAQVYYVDVSLTETKAMLMPPIKLPATNWMTDCVTDAFLDNNTLYLLTYSKIYKLEKVKNEWKIKSDYKLGFNAQKEGIALFEGVCYVTSEKSKIGTNKLFEIIFKD